MEAFSKLIQSLLNLRRKEHLQVWKQVDLDPIEIWNPLVPESFPLKAALFSFLPNNPHLMVTTSDILSWPCLSGKQFAYSAGDLGSIPGSGRSPGEGNGNPLQYSCLENLWTKEPGRLQSIGLSKSQTQLSDQTTATSLKLKPKTAQQKKVKTHLAMFQYFLVWAETD